MTCCGQSEADEAWRASVSDDIPAVLAGDGKVALFATGGPIQVGGLGLATKTTPVLVPEDEVEALCAEGKLARWEHTKADDEKPGKRRKEK
jgi:hypothetical protein